MTRPVSITALLLAALLLAGCSSQPVSQAGVQSPAASDAGSPGATGPASPDATPSSGAPSASAAAPAPTPVPATAPPPKPGNPTFALVIDASGSTVKTTDTYAITWTSPGGVADKFLVYGLPECLRDAKKYDGKPCIVAGMTIPAAHLVLLASAAGGARTVRVSWPTSGTGRPPYSAILMRATNSIGKSIFTIVHSEMVCLAC
jgi:hypothetical protein